MAAVQAAEKMEISETGPGTYNEDIHQFQPETTHEIH